jgi:hypothetical protein
MPEHTATDDGGQIDTVGETVAVFFIGEKICRQGQLTAGQHGDQTLVAQGADQAVESHRGDVAHDRTPCETEATVGDGQRLPSHVGAHVTVTQDQLGQDSEDGFTGSALNPPDREATKADTRIMRVSRQASTAVTGRFVGELEAKSQEKGEDAFDKRLAVAKQLYVGGFVVKIDGDGPVFSCRFGGVAHVSPLWYRALNVRRHDAGNALKLQENVTGSGHYH